MKRIVLTGGGTAGHVTPNIALLPYIRAAGAEVIYIGSKNGIEKDLIEAKGVKYYGISSGKMRRYLDPKNVTDIFRVIKGLSEAVAIIKSFKPDRLFSKGGFVVVPVVAAARLCGVQSIIHESDITPGLANKLCIPLADKVCCNFPETLSRLPRWKGVLTGTPIRAELFSGDKKTGLALCKFKDNKPIVMITGGSSGAQSINACVRVAIDRLTKHYNIVHLCGKGNIDPNLLSKPGYVQFEYVNEEQPHLFAASDMVISRAGANTIFELLALHKPNILIPLPKSASRGDQILNAESFSKSGYSLVLMQEDMTPDTLLAKLSELYIRREGFVKVMSGNAGVNKDATKAIAEMLLN